MALDVKYLRGTQAQYEAYIAADKIVDTYYYLIYETTIGVVTPGYPYLYIGKVRLDNAPFDPSILEGRLEDLEDRVDTLETDVATLKENAGHKFYEVTTLPELTEGHSYKEGDVVIVTETKEGIDFKTAYHLAKDAEDQLVWKAMAGNYNTSNVYYDKNIQVTQTVGNVVTSNNTPKDLEFKGKNLEQIWQYLYATEDKDVRSPENHTPLW